MIILPDFSGCCTGKNLYQYEIDSLKSVYGCDSLITTNLHVAAVPSVFIKTSSVDELVDGDELQLSASPSDNNFRFKWYENGKIVDTIFAAIHRYVALGTNEYRVVVKDTSGCSSAATISVSVGDKLKIPNAFTPNGDGLNDYFNFIISLDNPTRIVVDQFQVYDRNGLLIYDNEMPETGWNGKYFNTNCTSDVYVYTIVMHNKYSKTFKLSGDVLLVR